MCTKFPLHWKKILGCSCTVDFIQMIDASATKTALAFIHVTKEQASFVGLTYTKASLTSWTRIVVVTNVGCESSSFPYLVKSGRPTTILLPQTFHMNESLVATPDNFSGSSAALCSLTRRFMTRGAYTGFVQSNLAVAQVEVEADQSRILFFLFFGHFWSQSKDF